ncbi:LrgB family protein [Pyruvatibacter sp.]|uniref:LrgB family protein n=1 Tax=Pyruvatibacter sp. TaxID=1981328 RepID=UPI0032659504
MSALIWLAITVVAYLGALAFARRVNGYPLANPVLVASVPVILAMLATDTPHAVYQEGGAWLLALLGPATVALAIPLFRNWPKVRAAAGPLFLAIGAGSVTAVSTALVTVWALGAETQTLLSLAPKSVTTPIAMGIAQTTHGLPLLAAAIVIVTGVIGAIIGPWLLNRLGIKDAQAHGVALGTAAHGIGTARAFQESEETGTFSGVAMGVNGIATALLLPWLLIWLFA